MDVFLYKPSKLPQRIDSDGFLLPDAATGRARVTEHVAAALGCILNLVDVLDCSSEFVAYTVFDYEGANNAAATEAVMKWSKYPELYVQEELRGPVLVVSK